MARRSSGHKPNGGGLESATQPLLPSEVVRSEVPIHGRLGAHNEKILMSVKPVAIPGDDPSLLSRVRLLEWPVIAVVLLYAVQCCLMLALVFAANMQPLLTKEEASTSFVDPTFLQLHLQHHLFETNFYTYVYLLGASRIIPGLVYARFAKVVVMAFLPPLMCLYLRRRFLFTGSQAFLAAFAIGLLPGVICFSWIGTEYGLETTAGFLALWLALFEFPLAIVASCVAGALALGSFGSGLVFIPVVWGHHLPRLQNRKLRTAVILGSIVAALMALFPLIWWTNAQTLFMGGGRPHLAGGLNRLGSLLQELFLHGSSYYYFSNGLPALGSIVIGLACVAGIIAMGFREPSRSWPILVLAAGSLAVYAIAGNVIGVRRAIPLVVSLGICGALLLRSVTGRGFGPRMVFYGILSAVIVYELANYNRIRTGLATSEIALPYDFDFRIPPGKTMAETIRAFTDQSLKLPEDLDGYEPDRTLSILYRLSLPNPIVKARDLIVRCDRYGLSISSHRPRLEHLRKLVSRLLYGAYTAAR